MGELEVRDQSAARFAWDRGEPAGRGTDTLPAARWQFLPLATGRKKLGVLGIALEDDRTLAPDDRRLVEALCDQVAVAMERLSLSEELAESRLASETERLRTALLSSVSHDLRTPLVTIIGAAGSLADTPDLSDAARRDLAEAIREEGERLDRYVQNLLDMTRLGHGALKPRLAPVDLAEVIGSARTRMALPLRAHRLEVEGDPAAVVPGERKAPRRIEFEDAALHAVFPAETFGFIARRIGQFVVAPDQFEGRTGLRRHVAGRQPLPAQIAFGEVSPDALDRTGQQALDAHAAGRGDGGVIGFGRNGGVGVHAFLRGGRDLRTGLAALFASSALSRASRASSFCVQKRS